MEEIEDALLAADPTPLCHPRRPRPAALHRTHTAPDLAPRLAAAAAPEIPKPNLDSSGSILKYSFALLLIYLSVGVLVYSLNPKGFSGVETHPAVDALYFCIVTLCTIGYGDIAPLTPATKAFACAFVLVGFGLIDILLSGAVSYILDVQETLFIPSTPRRGATSYIFDAEKGRIRIRLKVALAIAVLVVCIGAGTVALNWLERMSWIDAFYLSVMSVTTVGYGDRAFKTIQGRAFASAWLLVSTLAVARSLLFLAEVRMEKRQREIAKWMMRRDITVQDLLAADTSSHGFISKSDFVVFKLKEMGKMSDIDIMLICNEFSKFDPNNTGRITIRDLQNHDR